MSPLRQLREGIAAALKPLGIEVHDVLPDTVNPPAVAIGIPGIGPSRAQPNLGMVLSCEVTLVGERADFHDTQIRLDDLAWQVWVALQDAPQGWLLNEEPATVTAGGQDFPAAVYQIEAPLPC